MPCALLGASAYKAQGIVASAETYRLIEERASRIGIPSTADFRRLFQTRKAFPG